MPRPSATGPDLEPAPRPLWRSAANTRLYVGTSGWAYPTWKPGFYPQGTPARKFLGFYSSELSSVEVNYTFNKVPDPAVVAGWCAEVAPGFRFSFKAPQRITHRNRLLGCEAELQSFFAALQPAAARMGCVLFQLPPNCMADAPRLRDFLQLPAFAAPGVPPVSFEFRHASWFADPCLQVLADAGAALCVAETDDLVTPEVHTAPAHASFRLRRDGGYTPAEIAAFHKRFRALAAAREVYAYFRHQDEPTGALNARALLQPARRQPPAQASLPLSEPTPIRKPNGGARR